MVAVGDKIVMVGGVISGTDIVKLIELCPVFCKRSVAKSSRICNPGVNPERVVFPSIVVFALESKL